MADGFTAGRNGAPAPDAARVEALRSALEAGGAEARDGFGRIECDDLTRTLERIGAEARHRDFAECQDLLHSLAQPLADMNPAALEPRRGLAGLFDSRGKRLKRMRERFREVRGVLTHVGEELTDRAERLNRRIGTLERLQTRLREQVLEIDAHVAAALGARQTRAQAESAEATGLSGAVEELARVVETEADTVAPAAQTAAKPSLTDELSSHSDAAVRRLAVVRMIQNASASALPAIETARAALSRWLEEWAQGLGIEGRRPRRIRADTLALTRGLDELRAALTAADQALDRVRGRYTEAERRL